MKKHFLLKPSLMLSAVVLLAALIYHSIYSWLTTLAKEFYDSTDNFRYPFLAARVVGYQSFSWILLSVLAAWCAALWADSHAKKCEAVVSRRLPAYFPPIIEGVAFLAMATVAIFLSDREWVRFGRPCWDNYCVYSELIFEWLQHPSTETWARLNFFLHWDYHSNSPLVPALVACTKLMSDVGVIASYRILCGGATGLGLLILFWFIRRRLAVSARNTAMIILLLVSNLVVIRSS